MFSPRFSARAWWTGRSSSSTSQRIFCQPDQFMMPSETGLWLPPVHVLVTVVGHPELSTARPQEVAGLERVLTNDGQSAVSVEWFHSRA